jgi:hypothetical protein
MKSALLLSMSIDSDPRYAPPQAEVELTAAEYPIARPGPGPAGIGGWLLLPAIGIILRPIFAAYSLVNVYLPIFRKGTWAKLTDPASKTYHVLWGPALTLEIAYLILMLGFCLVLMYHFFRKSAMTPRLYIALLIAAPTFALIDHLIATSIPAFSKDAAAKGISALFTLAVSAAVWIPYFIKSVRVKNTFIH